MLKVMTRTPHDKMTHPTKTYKFFKDYSSYINYK